MAFLTHAQKFEDAFGHAYDKNDWTWSSVNDHPDNAIEGVAHDLDILWNYHKEIYEFHTGSYLASQFHPWQSNPGGWLVLNRPIAFAVQTTDSIPNCPPGEQCVKEILALGNPVLWWGGVVALFVGLGYWVTRRDWRFGIPIVGVLTTWLPWFKFDNRQIFFYYGVSIIPFTIIAITLVLGKILGRAGAGSSRRLVGAIIVATFVIATASCFVYFYPILADRLLLARRLALTDLAHVLEQGGDGAGLDHQRPLRFRVARDVRCPPARRYFAPAPRCSPLAVSPILEDDNRSQSQVAVEAAARPARAGREEP